MVKQSLLQGDKKMVGPRFHIYSENHNTLPRSLKTNFLHLFKIVCNQVRVFLEYLLYIAYPWKMHKLSRLQGTLAIYWKVTSGAMVNEPKKDLSVFFPLWYKKKIHNKVLCYIRRLYNIFYKEYIVWEVMYLNCIPKIVYKKLHFLEEKYDWTRASFHISSESRSKWCVEFYDLPKRQLLARWHMNRAHSTQVPAASKVPVYMNKWTDMKYALICIVQAF